MEIIGQNLGLQPSQTLADRLLQRAEILLMDDNVLGVSLLMICRAKEGKILFKGAVTDFPWETRDGFNFGEIHLAGEGEYAGEQYKIWLKNENIISYRNGEVDVVAPDLICMIGEDGNPLTSPNFGIGQKMTVLALPSPEIWTTPEGLACFGPKHFGLDVEYKPFKK